MAKTPSSEALFGSPTARQAEPGQPSNAGAAATPAPQGNGSSHAVGTWIHRHQSLWKAEVVQRERRGLADVVIRSKELHGSPVNGISRMQKELQQLEKSDWWT